MQSCSRPHAWQAATQCLHEQISITAAELQRLYMRVFLHQDEKNTDLHQDTVVGKQ